MIDIIWSANLLHLFSWEKQVAALRAMAKLLEDKPDRMIVGRFMGFKERPGEYKVVFRGQEQVSYRHDAGTFRKLWGEALGEQWEVEADDVEWEESLKLRTKEKAVKTWDVEVRFVGRRVTE